MCRTTAAQILWKILRQGKRREHREREQRERERTRETYREREREQREREREREREQRTGDTADSEGVLEKSPAGASCTVQCATAASLNWGVCVCVCMCGFTELYFRDNFVPRNELNLQKKLLLGTSSIGKSVKKKIYIYIWSQFYIYIYLKSIPYLNMFGYYLYFRQRGHICKSAHTKTTAVSYAHQGILYIKNSNILKIWVQFTITIFYLKIFLNVVYSCDVKAEFSGSMLQVPVSRDLQKSF